jgi:DNA-binding transcriptional MerR regulator
MERDINDNEKKMEDTTLKTPHKKLIGSSLVVMMITTIGVVISSAQTTDTSNDTTLQKTFWGRQQMNAFGPYFSDLTEEQQTELNDLITTLKDQGATRDEIQAAIQDKLDEYGILDKRLDTEITQTEQQLTMLNRQKELRNEGYSWDEIRTIIQEEFNLTLPADMGQGMMFRHDFHAGPCHDGSHGLPDNNETLEQ